MSGSRSNKAFELARRSSAQDRGVSTRSSTPVRWTAAGAEEVEIVSVVKKDETATVKRSSDGKKFAGVPWAKLEPSE